MLRRHPASENQDYGGRPYICRSSENLSATAAVTVEVRAPSQPGFPETHVLRNFRVISAGRILLVKLALKHFS